MPDIIRTARTPRDVSGLEIALVIVIVVLIGAVIASGFVRARECDDLLASSRTHRDSLDVRLACNVRRGIR